MSALATPLRFSPFLRPMVWGGRRLEKTLHRRLPTREPYGESWEISDHAVHRSLVASGTKAGQSLRHLMEHERVGLLGQSAERHAVFPWLIKFLDAQDWLSVQVHPDSVAVRRLLPGEEGKTEAWLVLDAEQGSRIYAGLLPGVDAASLQSALAEAKVADCLHQFEPRPGDLVYLPAGTVHAVGGGVLMAEVQQTSDATFRLFDWNRTDAQGKRRPLHVEEALAAIHWDMGPVRPLTIEGFRPPYRDARTPDSAMQCHRQRLVRSPYFELEYRRETERFLSGGEGRMQVMIMVEGGGCWLTESGEEEVCTGQVWLLPASLPPTRLQPAGCLGFLLCSLPTKGE